MAVRIDTIRLQPDESGRSRRRSAFVSGRSCFMAHRWKDRAGMAGAVVMRFARWIGPLGMAFWLALAPSPGAAQGLLEFLFGAPAPPPAAPRPRESVPTRRDRVQGELRY